MSTRCHCVSRIAITADTFTPLIAPTACNYYRISNASGAGLRKRTNPQDPQTEVSVTGVESLNSTWVPPSTLGDQHPTRYQAGDVIWYAADPQGSSQAIIEVWI